jgi:hypothetical protein
VTPASCVIGLVAYAISVKSDKLILTEEELSTIQGLSPEELAEVETMCRVRATKWLAALRQVRAIVNEHGRAVA